MTVRFLLRTHDIRELKDRMYRDVLAALDEVQIGIASSTYDIVGLPPLHIDNLGQLQPERSKDGRSVDTDPQTSRK